MNALVRTGSLSYDLYDYMGLNQLIPSFPPSLIVHTTEFFTCEIKGSTSKFTCMHIALLNCSQAHCFIQKIIQVGDKSQHGK